MENNRDWDKTQAPVNDAPENEIENQDAMPENQDAMPGNEDVAAGKVETMELAVSEVEARMA